MTTQTDLRADDVLSIVADLLEKLEGDGVFGLVYTAGNTDPTWEAFVNLDAAHVRALVKPPQPEDV